MASPSLTRIDPDHAPSAVVLLLHGGKPRSTSAVDGRSASWQRMATLQRALAEPLVGEDTALWLLRYRVRGWNGGAEPIADAREALAEVRRTHGEVPIVLLGHSMGGRVAVHIADDDAVVGVVALAPWWDAGDPVETFRSRRVIAAHGRRDRITSFRATSAYLERARAAGVDAELVDMGWHGHYLLTGIRSWNRVARQGVRAALAQHSATD